MPYLKEQPSDQERLKALLRNHSGNDGILIQPNAFALRDAHNRSYELIYRKTNRSPEQDSLQIGNLRAFGLLFRMAFHLEEGGLMLHASSLEKDGAGYVFVGPSNAGKSTVAAMLKPDRILSDDIALIKRVGDTYSLYSNPWWSISSKVRISRPLVPAPLKALFFIEKARKNRMERLSYKEALSSFVYIDGSFQQAGFFNNKDGIRDFYAFAHELVKKVPAFRLDFKKSPELEGFFYRSVARYL
jgi:hypothetical protein